VVARVCGEAAADGVRRATGGIYRAAGRPWRAPPGRKSGVIPGRVSRLAVARPGEAGETTGPTSGPRWSAAKCVARAERGRRAGASRPARGELGRAGGLLALAGRAGRRRRGLRSVGRRGEREWLGRVGSERAARFGVGKRRVGHGPLRVGLGCWAAGKSWAGSSLGWVFWVSSFLFLIQSKFEFKYKFEFKPHSNN